MYQVLYQEVIEYFSYQEFKPEYEKSRLEFESKIGKVFEDDSFFEMWIETFIEYFTFDRVLPMYGMSPISLYFKMYAADFDQDRTKALQQLIANKLCVVRFDSKQGEAFCCTDLIGNKKITIYGIDTNHQLMLKKQDWLIVRLIEDDQRYQVFGSIWHFPKEIKHVLLTNLHRLQDKMKFVHDCMAKKVFSEQYKHVDLEKIYATNFQLKQTEASNAQT